jgi:hypothetical protein
MPTYISMTSHSCLKSRLSIAHDQTHRPVSAAVQTVQGRGTYQGTAFKDMVAEAVNQINHDLNKNNRNGARTGYPLCYRPICNCVKQKTRAQTYLALRTMTRLLHS